MERIAQNFAEFLWEAVKYGHLWPDCGMKARNDREWVTLLVTKKEAQLSATSSFPIRKSCFRHFSSGNTFWPQFPPTCCQPPHSCSLLHWNFLFSASTRFANNASNAFLQYVTRWSYKSLLLGKLCLNRLRLLLSLFIFNAGLNALIYSRCAQNIRSNIS